jgi:DNA (cytosine-5)-methyltransferase 1
MGRRDAETETLIPTIGCVFDDVAHTLKAEGFDAGEDGTGRGTPLVPVLSNDPAHAICANEQRTYTNEGNMFQLRNVVAQPVAFSFKDHGADATEDLSPTLRALGAYDANGGGQMAVALPLLEVGKRTGTSTDDPRAGIGIGQDGDPMYTLQAGAQHGVAVTPFDATQITSPSNYSRPQEGDPCHPLAAGAHPPAIAVSLRGREGGGTAELGDEVQNCLRASQGGGDKPHVLAAFEENFHAVREVEVAPAMTTEGYRVSQNAGGLGLRTGMAVRRLTPEECEALQGFPRGYTAIPWKKRPAEDCPDGPRYKALGNSMAVPVMRWIGARIAARVRGEQ